jgi:hypothetical protein
MVRSVLTDSISHDPVKDGTGTDQIGTHVVLEGTAIIHVGQVDGLTGVKGSASTLAYSLDDALERLSKDRRPFRYLIGGIPMYDIRPGNVEPGTPTTAVTAQLDRMDISHGPKCSVTVLKVVSGYSATIRFRVEFTVPNLDGKSNRSSLSQAGLLNLRYWVAEDLDSKMMTSRTYQGVLRVLHKGISPHALARMAAIPPLQKGFKRRAISLHESADGLTLNFTFQDVEIEAAAPWSPYGGFGATDWNGSWSLSTSSPNIATISELQFSLEGPKSTHKNQLLFLAMKIVEAKTHAISLFSKGTISSGTLYGSAFLEQFSIREELAENQISVMCRIRHTASKEQLLRLFAPGGNLNFGPLPPMGIGYDPDRAFAPNQTASLAGLFLSALQTPNYPASMPTATGKSEKPVKTESKDSGGAASGGGSLGSGGTAVSPDHINAQYLDYLIHSEMHVSSGKIALATGASANSSAASAAIVNLHRPMAMRTIALEATRIDQPPVLPDFSKDFADSNGIAHKAYGEAVVGADTPQLSADDRRLLYRVNMSMQYSLSRPPKAGDSIPLGAVPYRASSYSDPSRRLPSGIFVAPQNIIG